MSIKPPDLGGFFISIKFILVKTIDVNDLVLFLFSLGILLY